MLRPWNRSVVFFLLLGLCPTVRGQVLAAAAPAAETEPDEQSAGEGHLIHEVRADLVAERFDTLDQTAEGFRRSKARWDGGGWKLRTLYEALDFPHQTDPDMVAHLEHSAALDDGEAGVDDGPGRAGDEPDTVGVDRSRQRHCGQGLRGGAGRCSTSARRRRRRFSPDRRT